MTITRNRWRPPAATTLIALSLAAVLAGCSAGTSNSSSGGAVAPQKAPAGGAQQAPGGGTAKAPGGGTDKAAGGNSAALPAQAVIDTRAIVYTGAVTVRVKGDVAAAADSLAQQVRAAGGYVGDEKRSLDGRTGSDSLTLRVPSGRFASLLDEAAALGTETTRAVSTQDVTEEMVDLEARLVTARASVTRVRALLARAQSISDITTIESELAKREADLEALEGRKRSLEDLTTLSTITVTLLGPEAPAPAPKHAEPRLGFLSGLSAGWAALVGVVRVVLTLVGALLPFLVVLALALAPGLWWLRRRRRTAAGPPAPAGAAATTGEAP